MRGRSVIALLAVSALVLSAASPALAHPDQHGTPEGHLLGPGPWGDLELLGVARLTDVENLVADVSVDPSGNYAYLANWGRPDCAARSERGGRNNPDAGVWIVDISDLSNPRQVGFIPSSQDSRPGEGVQAINISTKFFNGTMLVINNEQCGPQGKGGVTLYDVTNPLKPKLLSKHFGDRGFADFHAIHSSFAWDAGDRAYVVIVDNFEFPDVDILDITNPSRPRLIAEYNLNTYVPGGVAQPDLHLDSSFIHDMVVKEIDGRFIMLVSYWDGGWVLLDVTDPTSAIYLGDTDYNNPDPQLLESTGIAALPEGNAHQAEFTTDNRFFIGTDEDFAPFGAEFRIETGPNAGEFPAGEFGWTVPVLSLPDGVLNGPVVYGGYGCPGTSDPIPPADTTIPPSSLDPGEEQIIVLQRGPGATAGVPDDPNNPEPACFPGEKADNATDQGWDAVILTGRHLAGGAAADDPPNCGFGAFPADEQIPAVCTTHTAMHELFGLTPDFSIPYVAANEPTLGQVGEDVTVTANFDGWGYVRVLDTDPASTPTELSQITIPETMDEDFATGFGDLTVHEVEVPRGDPNEGGTAPDDDLVAYFSWYSGGFRVWDISDPTSPSELGFYIDDAGNNFWGVALAEDENGDRIVLASDRDYGLFIFRYTGDLPA